jgi:hypothetical protein
MGDFNDYPDNISISETLGGNKIGSNIDTKKLYNLFYSKINDKDAGSYKYKGKWAFMDQFIVSGNLLGKPGKIFIKDRAAHTFSAEFLLEKDSEKYGGNRPFRTYSGWKYLGGYGDHLPVYIDLLIDP